MRKPWVLWTFALLITLASAVYQRMTGPTHPARGSVEIGETKLSYRLIRTHGPGEAEVRVTAPKQISGALSWKRNKTSDPWTYVPMRREGDELIASLPHQPPAGKLAYRVILQSGEERVTLAGGPVVIRFKGDVPLWVLYPHIGAMFVAMLLAARLALEKLAPNPSTRLVLPTLLLLTVGGMILGPVVQKYAFGAYWTGFPFGTDLTDNKTAVAWLAWVNAYFSLGRARRPWIWILLAAIVTFAVYLIPHSMFGSELKYG